MTHDFQENRRNSCLSQDIQSNILIHCIKWGKEDEVPLNTLIMLQDQDKFDQVDEKRLDDSEYLLDEDDDDELFSSSVSVCSIDGELISPDIVKDKTSQAYLASNEEIIAKIEHENLFQKVLQNLENTCGGISNSIVVPTEVKSKEAHKFINY